VAGPDLPAVARVVAEHAVRPDADHQVAAAVVEDQRDVVRLAEVAGLVAEVGRAVGLPDQLSGVLVERRDVLHVGAVAVQDEQVLVETGLDPGPSLWSSFSS
jgi:hypothetical protein